MYRYISIIILSILIVGCDFSSITGRGLSSNDIKWAKVDKRKIDNYFLEELKSRNIYPPELIKKQDELSREINDKADQIRSLNNIAREKCFKSSKDSAETKAPKQPREPREMNRPSPSIRDGRSYLSNKCTRGINDDPLIKDLKSSLQVKKAELKELSSSKRAHSSKISKKAKKLTQLLIESYAKNKFDLILDANVNELYNAPGISLDITDAVLDTVDIENLDLGI